MENRQHGARYLKYLLDLYNGNYALALAAYNAGEGGVAPYGDIPPYPETRDYVVKASRRLESLAAKTVPIAEQKLETASEVHNPGPAKIEEIGDASGTVRYVSR